MGERVKQKVVPRVEQLTAIRGGGRLENRDRGLAVLDFRGREELRIVHRDLERAVGGCDAQLERDRVSLLDRQLIRIRPKTASAVIQRNRMVRSEEHTSELQSLRHLVCR